LEWEPNVQAAWRSHLGRAIENIPSATWNMLFQSVNKPW
jgi:hypothetical protein